MPQGHPRKRASCEAIEPRTLLAASPLNINGTSGADSITLSAASGQLTVNINGAPHSYTLANVQSINISAGDGNDVVSVGSGIMGVYILGGAGADRLTGGDGNDNLNGGGGKDLLYGGAGDDRLSGLASNDALYGGDGADRLYGGDGDDYIEGGNGVDRSYGGIGNDNILGGGGNDKLYGEAGDDFLFGGKQNDLLNGGLGADQLIGQDGDDSLFAYDSAKDTVGGGTGTDITQNDSADDVAAVEHFLLAAPISDNFNDNSVNSKIWSSDIVGGFGTSSIQYSEQNQRLELLTENMSEQVQIQHPLKPEFPYNENWQVTVEVHNHVDIDTEPSVRLGIFAAATRGTGGTGIILKADDTERRLQYYDTADFDSPGDFSGVDPDQDAMLKISFNATSKLVTLWFASGIGQSFTSMGTLGIDGAAVGSLGTVDWGLSASDTITLGIFATDTGTPIVASTAWVDNLSAT